MNCKYCSVIHMGHSWELPSIPFLRQTDLLESRESFITKVGGFLGDHFSESFNVLFEFHFQSMISVPNCTHPATFLSPSRSHGSEMLFTFFCPFPSSLIFCCCCTLAFPCLTLQLSFTHYLLKCHQDHLLQTDSAAEQLQLSNIICTDLLSRQTLSTAENSVAQNPSKSGNPDQHILLI